jgi:hypothetical protein
MATIDECIEFALKNIGLWWRYGINRHWYWGSEADSPEVCRLGCPIQSPIQSCRSLQALYLCKRLKSSPKTREHVTNDHVTIFERHCDEWKNIIIGRIFESEIILIPPSLKISESSSNGSYRNTDEVWWRYGISRSCDECWTTNTFFFVLYIM